MRTAKRASKRRRMFNKFIGIYGKYVAAVLFIASIIGVIATVMVISADTDKRTVAAEPERATADVQTTICLKIEQPHECEYPFGEMSHDWSAEDVEGFTKYEIPLEYAKNGGRLPECFQIYTYCICKQNGIDFALLLAMIEHESGYKWEAKGKYGEKGYMQIIEKYHEERMHKLGVDNVDNPFANIRVAVDFLAELQEKYSTEAEVLTAYNFGENGAQKHVWGKGLKDCEYSREVQKIKARIERQLGGADNEI